MRSLAFFIASRMQWASRGKLLASCTGVAAGFFLTMAQTGLMMGWIDTCTLPISRADADLWVMGAKSPAFDYGSPIPRQRLYQARSVPGVDTAHPMVMVWTIWERSDGRKVNVEMIGLDDTLAGGPNRMIRGDARAILGDRKVVVDAMYLDLLGVKDVGDRFEILGRRAEVVGISEGVRTFTASPFIFTSIEDAILYDKRYRHDQITYVMIKCSPEADIAAVAQSLRDHLPSVEVLTNKEFRRLTADYWMIGTGIGFTVIVTALLGLIIGALVISQTLFSLLQNHRPHYATLLALGFDIRLLGRVMLHQTAFLWLAGVIIGGGLFSVVQVFTERSPIPMRMPAGILCSVMILQGISALAAGRWILRKLHRIDPVSVFQS